MKEFVIPGEKVEGQVNAYCYKDGDENFSQVLGIVDKHGDKTRIVPLNGKYNAHCGDYVIGIVSMVKHGGAVVEISSPNGAFLPTRNRIAYKDLISAEVIDIDEIKHVTLGNERKLFGGELIEISPVKVPRLIGKSNSMVNMLKTKTGCMIFIGRNGRVWLKGDSSEVLKKAIKKIEKEAHTSGLTERIEKYLDEAMKGSEKDGI